MKDEMKMGDPEIKIETKCAKCGSVIQAGETHQCPKENEDENSDSKEN